MRSTKSHAKLFVSALKRLMLKLPAIHVVALWLFVELYRLSMKIENSDINSCKIWRTIYHSNSYWCTIFDTRIQLQVSKTIKGIFDINDICT